MGMTSGSRSKRSGMISCSIAVVIINLIGSVLGPPIAGLASDFLTPLFAHDAMRYSLLSMTVLVLAGAILAALAARSRTGQGERIELVHRAMDRDIFARGALQAATALAGSPPGLYSMRGLLFGPD